ncbi:MAG: hypothetical protein IKO39_11030 [Treponema sp.]|nr:hypothetical protein [Treponema sp.]
MKNEYIHEKIEKNKNNDNNENDNLNNNNIQLNGFDEFNDNYEDKNNIEYEYNKDNQIILKDQENIKLKNKIEELNQILFIQNEELENNRRKNDNQLASFPLYRFIQT